MQHCKLKQAEEHFREVLRIDPRTALAYNRLGLVYKMWEQLEQAVKLFRRAVEVDPYIAMFRTDLRLILKNREAPELAKK